MRMKRISGWLMAGAAAIALAACGEKAPEPPPEVSPETAQIPAIAPNPAQGDGGVSAFYDPAGPAPATFVKKAFAGEAIAGNCKKAG
jgi:predicted small lipoprotein YifL